MPAGTTTTTSSWLRWFGIGCLAYTAAVGPGLLVIMATSAVIPPLRELERPVLILVAIDAVLVTCLVPARWVRRG